MRYIKFARTLTFFGFCFDSCAPFSLLLLLLFSSSDDEDDEDTADRLATKALVQMNPKPGSTFRPGFPFPHTPCIRLRDGRV